MNLKCPLCFARKEIKKDGEIFKIRSNIKEFNKIEFKIWQCANCGSIHALESVNLEYYYNYYPNHQQNLGLVEKILYNNHLSRLKRLGFKKSSGLLDFGCGNGNFVSFLVSKGYQKCVGYDQFAKPFNKKIEGRFDFVFCNEVLEHVEDPRRLLKTLGELCNPLGVIFIGTPNADKIDLNGPARFLNQLHQPFHRHILSEKQMDELAKAHGLEVIKKYYRYYGDTLFPFINEEFGLELVFRDDNCLDILIVPQMPALLSHLRSPIVLFKAFFGYFLNRKTSLDFFYRNANQPQLRNH